MDEIKLENEVKEENVDVGSMLIPNYGYNGIMKLSTEYDIMLKEHGKKLGELDEAMEQADHLITNILNYVNTDLYDWVVQTEKDTKNNTRKINSLIRKTNDISYESDNNKKDIKYQSKLLNSLCVNTYQSLKTMLVVCIGFVAIWTGALCVGIFGMIDSPDLFYAMLTLVSFIFGAFGIAIACLIRDMKNSFRATYRMVYFLLKDTNKAKSGPEDKEKKNEKTEAR